MDCKKEPKLKKIFYFVTCAIVATVLAGCGEPLGERTLLTVDFNEGETLRYQFASSRRVYLDWGTGGEGSCCGDKKKRKKGVTQLSESMTIVMAYEPVRIDPYGLTTIKATCESVKVDRRAERRRPGTGKDAVLHLKGKSFTFTVAPNGKIEDYSQLDELVREIGEKAFRADTSRGRIKEPDSISDFLATQWFLWDSVSSLRNGAKGARVGQSWKSVLSVPTPMVMRKARDVTYTLSEIREGDTDKLAVLESTYSLADSVPSDWPVPYHGRFQVSGTFGFLTNYQAQKLDGKGEELFNIDKGRTEKYRHEYTMEIDAGMRFPLGPQPKITIKQVLTMKRIK